MRQDMQCTYNETLRRVVAVEKHQVLHILSVCVCIFRYPACSAHAPYCHLWPARVYCILPRYLAQGTIYGKQLLNTKCVFLNFCATFFRNVSHSKNNGATYDKKCVLVFM